MVGWNGADTLTINANQGDTLRILVENGGRTNYWSGYLPNLEHAVKNICLPTKTN